MKAAVSVPQTAVGFGRIVTGESLISEWWSSPARKGLRASCSPSSHWEVELLWPRGPQLALCHSPEPEHFPTPGGMSAECGNPFHWELPVFQTLFVVLNTLLHFILTTALRNRLFLAPPHAPERNEVQKGRMPGAVW